MADNEDKDVKTAKQRERELFRAIGSTPLGRELIEIWKRQLICVKFPPELSEASCRYTSGRHSLMTDFIKEAEKDR